MTKNNDMRLIPHHLAIIMDGNDRWAQARGLPHTAGHQAGVQTARRVVDICSELRIHVLTLYVFSTKNWCRQPNEVAFMMRLSEEYVYSELPELQHNGIRIQHMGRRVGLPKSLLFALDNVISKTRANNKLVLNPALNDGGRGEITDAIRAIIAAHQCNELNASELTPADFARYLYCLHIPDADLISRIGGN